MKINENIRGIEKSSNLVEQEFKISASAQAFDILSSKIYTDIPLAIVRELSTNAYDSHKQAGKQATPIVVHLPTISEPYYSIRDYGTGLNDQDVKNIYTTYFSSTRNQSNDFMGCFGLGSKTPFAYTDKFSITSYFDGEAKYYCLYKNEKGVPAITTLHEEKTTEHNGLLVKININQQDIPKFHAAAQKIYEFFAIRPVLNIGINFPKRETLFSCGGNSLMVGNEEIKVILGQIPYYFDPSKIRTRINGLSIINLNIGDCSVSASREELHYDAKTVEAINIKMAELHTFIKDKYLIESKACTNNLDLFYCWKKFSARIRGLSEVKLDIPQGTKGINNYYKNLRLSEINSWYGLPNIKPLIVKKDAEFTPKLRKNLKYLTNTSGTGKEIFWVLDCPEDLIKKFCGIPDYVLSKIPDAPRNSQNSTTTKQYIKLICNGNLVSAQDIDEHKACYISKCHDSAMLNGIACDSYFINSLYKFLGFERAYAISNTRINSLKGNLVSLESYAKTYIETWFKNTNKYEKAALKFGKPDEYRVDLKQIAKIKDLSPECLDYYNLCTTKDIDNNIISLIRLFGIKNDGAINYEEIFNAKYPLVSIRESLIDESIFYIKQKECHTLSQKPA